MWTMLAGAGAVVAVGRGSAPLIRLPQSGAKILRLGWNLDRLADGPGRLHHSRDGGFLASGGTVLRGRPFCGRRRPNLRRDGKTFAAPQAPLAGTTRRIAR